jgi:hypothetical protein
MAIQDTFGRLTFQGAAPASREKICKLIGEFVPKGQSYREIPIERRAEFMEKLGALR